MKSKAITQMATQNDQRLAGRHSAVEALRLFLSLKLKLMGAHFPSRDVQLHDKEDLAKHTSLEVWPLGRSPEVVGGYDHFEGV